MLSGGCVAGPVGVPGEQVLCAPAAAGRSAGGAGAAADGRGYEAEQGGKGGGEGDGRGRGMGWDGMGEDGIVRTSLTRSLCALRSDHRMGAALDDPSGKSKPRPTARGVARVAQTVDALSLRAGATIQRSSFLRSLVLAYILGLHFAVFIILAVASTSRALARP